MEFIQSDDRFFSVQLFTVFTGGPAAASTMIINFIGTSQGFFGVDLSDVKTFEISFTQSQPRNAMITKIKKGKYKLTFSAKVFYVDEEGEELSHDKNFEILVTLDASRAITSVKLK